MQSEIVGFIGLAALMLLLVLRMPIGVSLIAVSFAGICALIGLRPAVGMVASLPHEFVSKWTLSSVPMFLLMGFICYNAGLTQGLFRAARSWLSGLPGGLAVASVWGSAGFAAVTGSSIACCAAMGRIAVPELLRAGYHPALATGVIAAAGTLGALIPPSILMILFGVFAEVPISKLLIGGIGPGLLTALLYMVTITTIALVRPEFAPSVKERASLSERLVLLGEVWPVGAMLVVIIGGLFVGLFTATEAGAIGALAALVIAVLKRAMTWKDLWKSLTETIVTTASLFLIAIGANLLTRFLTLSGTGDLITATITSANVSLLALLTGITGLYLVLGMFLDPVGAMLLTLPVLLPVLDENGIGLVWFGVFLVKLLEIGMITPPIGLNVFVLKSVLGGAVPLTTVFRGILWFLVADLVVVVLLIAFPGIITWLPSLMD